jgi:hypothetical protein
MVGINNFTDMCVCVYVKIMALVGAGIKMFNISDISATDDVRKKDHEKNIWPHKNS